MTTPRGFRKEYLNRKTGGAKFAGVPQIPNNDPKHIGVDKDWLKKMVGTWEKERSRAVAK